MGIIRLRGLDLKLYSALPKGWSNAGCPGPDSQAGWGLYSSQSRFTRKSRWVERLSGASSSGPLPSKKQQAPKAGEGQEKKGGLFRGTPPKIYESLHPPDLKAQNLLHDKLAFSVWFLLDKSQMLPCVHAHSHVHSEK